MSDLEPLALLSAEAALGVVLPPELRRLYGGDLALPERCVYANFVQTIDGVVAIPSIPDSNRLVSGGSEADRFVMGLLRAAADVVLIGSGTLRASARGRWRPDGGVPGRRGGVRRAPSRARSPAAAACRDPHRLGVDPVGPCGTRGRAARLDDERGRRAPGGHASRRRRGRRAARATPRSTSGRPSSSCASAATAASSARPGRTSSARSSRQASSTSCSSRCRHCSQGVRRPGRSLSSRASRCSPSTCSPRVSGRRGRTEATCSSSTRSRSYLSKQLREPPVREVRGTRSSRRRGRRCRRARAMSRRRA